MGIEATERPESGPGHSCQPATIGLDGLAAVLQDLAGLVAHVCKSEIASIGLLDDQQRWHQLPGVEGAIVTPSASSALFAEIAACPDLWIVPDTHAGDEPPAALMLGVGTEFRFFVGAPLRDATGQVAGALWTAGRIPHQMSAKEETLLRSLLRQVSRQFELQRGLHASAELARELARLASFPEQNPHPVVEFDVGGRVTYQNPAARTRFPDLGKAGLAHTFFERIATDVGALQQGGQEVVVREVALGDAIYEQRLRRIPQTGLIRVFAYDITARVRAEEMRCEIQEQTIRAQAAALIEMSAPLIPLSDQILLMPLVGSIDPRRAGLVIDTLLRGIVQHRARSVILDATGVSAMGAPIADAILRATQAARLLGTRIILTGLGAEGAKALVALGARLQGIIVHSTVQQGVSYALGAR